MDIVYGDAVGRIVCVADSSIWWKRILIFVGLSVVATMTVLWTALRSPTGLTPNTLVVLACIVGGSIAVWALWWWAFRRASKRRIVLDLGAGTIRLENFYFWVGFWRTGGTLRSIQFDIQALEQVRVASSPLGGGLRLRLDTPRGSVSLGDITNSKPLYGALKQAKGQERCSSCGYELTGLTSDRCPECGLRLVCRRGSDSDA